MEWLAQRRPVLWFGRLGYRLYCWQMYLAMRTVWPEAAEMMREQRQCR